MSFEIISFFHVLICFLPLICQGVLSTMYTKLLHRRTIFLLILFPEALTCPQANIICLGQVDSISVAPCTYMYLYYKGKFYLHAWYFYYCNNRFICFSSLSKGDTSVRWATLCTQSVVQSTWLTKLCPSVVVIITRCVYSTRQHLLHSVPQKRKTNWRQVT